MKIQNASAICKDCRKRVAIGEFEVRILDDITERPIITGSLLFKTAAYHNKFKAKGEDAAKFPQHNEMTVVKESQTLGSFITTYGVSAAAFTIEDKSIRHEMDQELYHLRRKNRGIEN